METVVLGYIIFVSIVAVCLGAKWIILSEKPLSALVAVVVIYVIVLICGVKEITLWLS